MPVYTPDNFTPDSSVGYLTKRVHHEVMAVLEPLFADAELTFTQWSALISIHFGNGRTCAALSRDIGHDMGATSRMIGALAGRGLLERSRNAEDRRIVDLTLTPAGADLAIGYRARLIDQWNAWLADWSREEVDALTAGLRRLRATLEAARAEAA